MIGIREFDAARDRTDLHIFHHWCHLATVHDHAELDVAIAGPTTPLAFDLDVYRLLSKTLSKPMYQQQFFNISGPADQSFHRRAAIIAP